MLTFITQLPADKPIAGVHCVPVLDNGDIVMVWDREEKGLTTIGGRLEKGETIDEGLKREAMEEAGILLEESKIPFASWYWENTQTYTVWFLTKVKAFTKIPSGYEKTGYVIMNVQTAIEIITKLEGIGERVEIIRRAGILTGQLEKEEI
jgi:8-oxo-dGTP pyrophosphatase MutT (NUDIX family)